ncbi:MAG: BACON domain-containing protein [Bacteroidaceae bacterium]|nr:BACON domain-containing protein [Bacteroidaceae bacterium]
MMKKAYSLGAIAGALLLFASCNKDPENHVLSIVHPYYSAIDGVLYAEQDNDSIIFESFDSYYMEPMVDWIKITAGESYDVKYDYTKLYTFKSFVSFDPNTTGITRVGSVKISSYYNSAAVFYQLGCLNINHPAPGQTETRDSVSFDLDVTATSTLDSICFNVSKPWTLNYAENADQTWATIDQSEGEAGKSKVTLTIEPNNTENARATVFELKCGGVTNLININQAAAKNND